MSKKRFELLSERQWKLIEPLLPEPKRRKDKRGRPWASNRACLEGILWVLQTGAAWRFLPDKYPSPATCWRRLKQWEEQNVWLDAWRTLLGALDGEGLLKWEETFLDGSFALAKKGVPQSVKPRRGKGTKWMVLVDGGGLPLGVRLESASPGKATLVEATLAEVKVPRPKGRPRQKPKRVIADRAYDSDPLRERLKKRGIDLIVPYRKNTNSDATKTAGSSADTSVDGSSNEPTPGLGNSEDSLFVMSTSSPPTEPSSISLASGSR